MERVVVKRNNPRLFDVYGHWWIEIDGEESYGWWPSIRPVGIVRGLRGVRGVLNGQGANPDATATRDPHHGELADHVFHPVRTHTCSDEAVVRDLRRFATTFNGEWRWSTRPTVNCRSFQLDLLAAAGLTEPAGYEHTRGDGCPFLAPIRRTVGSVATTGPPIPAGAA